MCHISGDSGEGNGHKPACVVRFIALTAKLKLNRKMRLCSGKSTEPPEHLKGQDITEWSINCLGTNPLSSHRPEKWCPKLELTPGTDFCVWTGIELGITLELGLELTVL